MFLGQTIADALARIGPKSAKTLISVLKSKNAAARRFSAMSLGKLGAAGESGVPGLIEALRDADVDVRIAAAEAFGNIGRSAKAAVPHLVQMLREHVRVDGPVYTRPGPPEHAVQALLKMGPDAEAALLRDGLPVLIERAARHQDRRERNYGLRALATLGPRAKSAVPVLAQVVREEDDFVPPGAFSQSLGLQSSAINALQSIGPEGYVALGRLLKDKNAQVRLAVATMCGWNLGWSWAHYPQGREKLTPFLIEALKDADIQVRAQAALALGTAGRAAKEAVPALITALADRELAKLRLPMMYGAILEGPVRTRNLGWADGSAPAAALFRIGHASVPALMVALASDDALVRFQAAQALGEFRPRAAEALPALEIALRDKTPEVQAAAARAVLLIGPAAEAPLRILLDAARDESGQRRMYAVSDYGDGQRRACRRDLGGAGGRAG